MIVRVALLILIVVLVLALVGRWRRLPKARSRPAVEAARKCPVCGTYVLAGEPVPCERCRGGSAGG